MSNSAPTPNMIKKIGVIVKIPIVEFFQRRWRRICYSQISGQRRTAQLVPEFSIFL